MLDINERLFCLPNSVSRSLAGARARDLSSSLPESLNSNHHRSPEPVSKSQDKSEPVASDMSSQSQISTASAAQIGNPYALCNSNSAANSNTDSSTSTSTVTSTKTSITPTSNNNNNNDRSSPISAAAVSLKLADHQSVSQDLAYRDSSQRQNRQHLYQQQQQQQSSSQVTSAGGSTTNNYYDSSYQECQQQDYYEMINQHRSSVDQFQFQQQQNHHQHHLHHLHNQNPHLQPHIQQQPEPQPLQSQVAAIAPPQTVQCWPGLAQSTSPHHLSAVSPALINQQFQQQQPQQQSVSPYASAATNGYHQPSPNQHPDQHYITPPPPPLQLTQSHHHQHQQQHHQLHHQQHPNQLQLHQQQPQHPSQRLAIMQSQLPEDTYGQLSNQHHSAHHQQAAHQQQQHLHHHHHHHHQQQQLQQQQHHNLQQQQQQQHHHHLNHHPHHQQQLLNHANHPAMPAYPGGQNQSPFAGMSGHHAHNSQHLHHQQQQQQQQQHHHHHLQQQQQRSGLMLANSGLVSSSPNSVANKQTAMQHHVQQQQLSQSPANLPSIINRHSYSAAAADSASAATNSVTTNTTSAPLKRLKTTSSPVAESQGTDARLIVMNSSASPKQGQSLCRRQSSSVVSTSSIGSDQHSHSSPRVSPSSNAVSLALSVPSSNTSNKINRLSASIECLEIEPDNKESQLSQLHQQCAVLLDEQQHLQQHHVAINHSPNLEANSTNNGTNASNGSSNTNNNNNSSSNGNNNNSGRSKRLRTSFKHNQLKEMKRWFSKNQNPDAKDLKTLAQTTGLSKRVLQVWFQNARAKYRRNNAKATNQQIYDVNQHTSHLLQFQQQQQQQQQNYHHHSLNHHHARANIVQDPQSISVDPQQRHHIMPGDECSALAHGFAPLTSGQQQQQQHHHQQQQQQQHVVVVGPPVGLVKVETQH